VKKYTVFAFALSIIMLGLGVNANAQNEGKVFATIPFDFEVGGKTLPAGTYTVTKVSDNSRGLLISNRNQGVFALPVSLDNVQAGGPLFSFEKVAGKYLLSEVNTPVGAYIIDTRHEEIKLAQTTQHGGMSPSGSN
jgi:hypothetical protein